MKNWNLFYILIQRQSLRENETEYLINLEESTKITVFCVNRKEYISKDIKVFPIGDLYIPEILVVSYYSILENLDIF